MNKVTLFGRIGKEPETKNVGGNYVAEFSLATTKKWKNKQGEMQEKTEWHNVTAWGGLGKLVKTQTEKGSRILIEGEINYQTWDKKDGSKGYKTVINATNVSLVDFAKKEQQEEQQFDISDVPF